MKKLITLIILSAFAVGIIGCGDAGTQEVTTNKTGGASGTMTKSDKEADKGLATPGEVSSE